MSLDYCKETGRKIKISCHEMENTFEDYKSCLLTAEDEQVRVILFQIIMGLLGGLAYWGIQNRKQKTMSRFDHRKLR